MPVRVDGEENSGFLVGARPGTSTERIRLERINAEMERDGARAKPAVVRQRVEK
jgi:hypothetical protein